MTDEADDQGGDAWDNLIRELRVFKATVESFEAPLAKRLRTGSYDIQDELSAWLGGSRADYAEAFLEDAEPETTLARRLPDGPAVTEEKSID